jgi:predicted transcriptional regulator
VATIMQLDASTVTRLVEKLEKQGFVKRHTEGKFTRIYPLAPALELDPLIKQSWMNLFKRYSALLGEERSVSLAEELTAAAFRLEKK